MTVVLALATLSFATTLKLVPPAATKLVIDYVLLAQAVAARTLPSWLPIPAEPEARLVALVGAVLVVSVTRHGDRALGPVAGDTRDQAGAGRGTAAGVRARGPAAAAPGLSAQGREGRRACSARMPGASASWSSACSTTPGGPWSSSLGGLAVLAWVDWRLLLGSFCLLPGAYWSDRLWNRWLRPLYRDVRKQRQEIDAKTAEAFGGMRVVRAFGRQRREAARFVGENHFLARQELFAWWWSRIVEVVWDLLLPARLRGACCSTAACACSTAGYSLGDLMMFLVYLAMLLEPLAVLATSATQLQNNLSGFDRVLDLLAEPREMAARAGRDRRHEELGRGPDHARGRQLRLPEQRHTRSSATSTWTSSPAR